MKDRHIRGSILYTMAALLFVFYVVLLLISSRDTGHSEEYRMVYIDHLLKYYVPDGGLQAYGCNQVFQYGDGGMFLNQGTGWADMDAGASESRIEGDAADMYFYVDLYGEDGYYFYMKLTNAGGCVLYCNDIFQGELVTDENSKALLELTAGAVQPGLNRFTVVRTAPQSSEPGVSQVALLYDGAE